MALDMEMSLLEAKAFKEEQKTLKTADALIDELPNNNSSVAGQRNLSVCHEVHIYI